MSPIERLLGHCNEKYPHFECERGQADIKAAKAEYEQINAIVEMAENVVCGHNCQHVRCWKLKAGIAHLKSIRNQ